VNHQTSLHTYISPQAFQATKETKKTLKQTKEYPVQHAKNKVLLQQMEANLSSSFQFCFPCISVLPMPSLAQLSSQTKGKKKKKKAANTREFRKRSEQKGSKNQTLSLLS
jgi:flagellar motor switch protein FliM